MTFQQIKTSIMLILILFMTSTCFVNKPTSQLTELVQEDLQNLRDVTRIEIYYFQEGPSEKTVFLNTIEYPEIIDNATQFFESQTGHWEYPLYLPYALPGPIEVDFYENDKLKLKITLGYVSKNPNENRRFYLSRSLGPLKYLEKNEFKRLVEVLGLNEETILEILEVPASYDTTNQKTTTN